MSGETKEIDTNAGYMGSGFGGVGVGRSSFLADGLECAEVEGAVGVVRVAQGSEASCAHGAD